MKELKPCLLAASIAAISVTISGCMSTGAMVASTAPVWTRTTSAPEETAKPAQVETIEQGVAKKTANVRSGPGTRNRKVGRLPKGATMRVLDKQGKWLEIEAETPKGLVSGWIYAPLVSVSTITRTVEQGTDDSAFDRPVPAGKNNIFYAGYSKAFLPVKRMMRSGDLEGIEAFFKKREEKVRKESRSEHELIEKIGLLRWMERGTLGLDRHNLDAAVSSFENAERIINARKSESHASDLFGSLTSFAAETITGNEEFMRYEGEGFEKVLMLNYKSIAYLLDGQRKAYNTTRRAIDWQQLEKEKFRKEIAKARREAKSKATHNSQDTDGWKAAYKKYDHIANKVASAYVNPFGYYVAGMIQEYESKDDRSLRDNARIAYEKALELNPDSEVIQQAVQAMKKKYNKNKRLVHVVVADGFVPEKKMLVYNIPTNNGIVPVKLPLYEPVTSLVHRLEVQTVSGKRLARLSTVADIEAITMRHQKDSEGFRALRVTLAIARAVGVNAATSRLGVIGNLVGSAVNNLSAPDMRSWMSLPATIKAARLNLSKNIRKIKLVAYDKRGRKLSSKTLTINKKSDNFIYARTVDKQMYANVSKKLWL